ncbi:MAG: thiamine pyrophosphate-binding protein [Pseudomonadota bacterium]
MSQLETVRTADVLARRLYDAGVRHAFGMPGGEVLTILDALTKAGIAFHLVKHENAGGFMAEGVYHRTGAPAVLVATVGPGALNAVNVVENARQDRVPMIFITGAVDADEAQSYTHQVLDQRAVFGAVTKASFTMVAGAAHVIADKAVSLANAPRQGPVHIDLPIGVADAVVSAEPPMPSRQSAYAATAPIGADLDQARQWLSEAVRPVAIAGLDVLAEEGAAAAVADFCAHHNVPLITTYKGKGILREDHPLALGGAGLSPLADKHLLPFVAAADLVLCLGYDPIEMRTGWRAPWDPAQQRVIDIMPEPNSHYMHQATLSMVADLGPTLDALSHDLTPMDTWSGGEVAQVKGALATDFPENDEWGPAAVIATCRDVLPETTLATVDSGAHRILLSQMWRCPEPRTLVQSSGLCTMGCALPLALGLSIADQERPVVGFMGDAGFLMVAGELATAAEMGLRTIFVVFVDDSLALIEKKQRERQLANAGVDFEHHDYAAMARAFGGAGHTVRDRDALRAALDQALDAPTFTLIATVIPRGAYDGRI